MSTYAVITKTLNHEGLSFLKIVYPTKQSRKAEVYKKTIHENHKTPK